MRTKELNKLPKSKEAALKLDLNTYFDGTTCVQGHKQARYLSGGCVPCAIGRAKKINPIVKKKRKQKTKNIYYYVNY